ncbi:MAG: hypothetical protein R3B70_41995 [Polyangiaceae bacterium]
MALSKFRPIREGHEYAPWVGETAGAHGVYVIRERSRRGRKAVVLYVGESHTHRLRETLQRHYQRWNGRTAGPTFDAAKTEVAMEIFLDGTDAIQRQDELIRRLRPTHNVVVPGENEAPRKGRKAREAKEDAAFDELMDYFGGLGE